MAQMGVENDDQNSSLSPQERQKVRRGQSKLDTVAADIEFEAAMTELFDSDSTPTPPSLTESDNSAPKSRKIDDSRAIALFQESIQTLETVQDKDQPAAVVSTPEKTLWEELPKRKPLPLDDSLDLHGATLEDVVTRLERFIYESHKNRLKRVSVITGKGMHSPDQKSVLRPEVLNWLFSSGSKYVKSVAQAPRIHGGRGVLIVTLR